MKKSLFLILSILSIFIFTDNVNALSFTATNGQEYAVDSAEKLLDYCYYTYIKDTNYANYNFLLGKTSTGDYKFILYTSSSVVNHYNSKVIYIYPNSSSSSFSNYSYYTFNSSYSFISSSSSKNTDLKTIVYSANNIYSGSAPPFETTSFTSNTSVTEIESRYGVIPTYTITYYLNNEVYKTFEVKEGTSHDLLTYNFNKGTHNFSGWQYDETIDLTNITSNITINATLIEKDVIPVYIEFPINKTEFYALLIEVGVLIMMLFLKWCFPFKGGSDLK